MMEFLENRGRNLPNQLILNVKSSKPHLQATGNGTLIILFLKNEPKKLLKTKDEPKKRTENEAKTNQAILLKTKVRLKNEPKTNRKTKRAKLLKIKTVEKTNRKTVRILPAALQIQICPTQSLLN